MLGQKTLFAELGFGAMSKGSGRVSSLQVMSLFQLRYNS